MKILKFGGSSVSSPERIKDVVHIIQKSFSDSPKLAIVVSAFGGVTDELIHISHLAAKGNSSYQTHLDQLFERHIHALNQITSTPLTTLETFFKELSDALHGIMLIKELSKRSLDFIMSFGERFSALIISEALKNVIPNATYLDARDIIITDAHFGQAAVLEKKTHSLIQKYFSQNLLPVITGFIGSTETHETTTLGRGGSDYTAAILGAALNAQIIEIWTDVDGVMTADPRKVAKAFTIPEMSYKEVLEMSHFGAKVLHPPTVSPALQKNIPIRIKNTFNPTAPGTLISHKTKSSEAMICGISSIDSIALLRVEGSGMVGVCGIAMRLFGALAKKEINVILITQGSSEHSICFGVTPHNANLAKEAIEQEFALEQNAGLIDPLVVENDLSAVAIVGENMRHVPGIAGKFLGSLGKNGINIIAIVQGSSEYNITVVIKKDVETKALNAIHEEFFLSGSCTLHVFLVGTGLIGHALLQQINSQIKQLQQEHFLDIKVCGLANSKHMHFDSKGMDLSGWQDILKESPPMHLSSYIKKMKEMNLINSIFVDCTSDQQIADSYNAILESNISIVTPNKKANSGSYSTYCELKKTARSKGVNFLYEANVGAGLPILNTLSDLRTSGDKILKIEAVLSGTLSYLFNTFNEQVSFSDTLLQAQKLGFTEPDPRDDLNGKDVARKLLILVRESGYSLELDDIDQKPFISSDTLRAESLKTFYKNLENENAVLLKKYIQAKNEKKVLRYIASYENGLAKISLTAVDQSHPFYNLTGNDNIIAITTERYKRTPLVIKGQGAGAEVTASAVFADIMKCKG